MTTIVFDNPATKERGAFQRSRNLAYVSNSYGSRNDGTPFPTGLFTPLIHFAAFQGSATFRARAINGATMTGTVASPLYGPVALLPGQTQTGTQYWATDVADWNRLWAQYKTLAGTDYWTRRGLITPIFRPVVVQMTGRLVALGDVFDVYRRPIEWTGDDIQGSTSLVVEFDFRRRTAISPAVGIWPDGVSIVTRDLLRVGEQEYRTPSEEFIYGDLMGLRTVDLLIAIETACFPITNLQWLRPDVTDPRNIRWIRQEYTFLDYTGGVLFRVPEGEQGSIWFQANDDLESRFFGLRTTSAGFQNSWLRALHDLLYTLLQ